MDQAELSALFASSANGQNSERGIETRLRARLGNNSSSANGQNSERGIETF